MDVERLRAETPGCQDKVYLAAPGTALQSAGTHAAVRRHLAREIELGGYNAQFDEAEVFDQERAALAALLGAEQDHVALAESGTHAWWRLWGALDLCDGDRVVVSAVDYLGTVLPPLQRGVSVDVLPVGPDGVPDEDIAAEIFPGARAVVVCQAASHVGAVLDVDAVAVLRGALAPEAWFVVDVCQSAGQVSVDLAGWGADAVFGTGRKWLRGPRGTGFLAVGDRVLALTPTPLDTNTGMLIDGVAHPAAGIQRFEPFEASWAAHAGLSCAVRELLAEGPNAVHDRIDTLNEGMRRRLADLPGLAVLDQARNAGGIVTFVHRERAAAEVVAIARDAGIVLGMTSPHPAPYDDRLSEPVVRAGAHVYNTDEELDRLADLLAAI